MAETLYPVFLKLADRKVVLVGAGPVAASKLSGLRAAGARITVVAPEIAPAMRQQLAQAGEVTVVERAFADRDLDGAFFVVAAAPPDVNRAVSRAAEARGLFVNAVDDKAAASAYLPAVVRSFPVIITVSTSGDAPALSGLLREALEAVLPDAETLADWHAEAVRLRAEWKAAPVPMEARRPLLLDALTRLHGGKPDGQGHG